MTLVGYRLSAQQQRIWRLQQDYGPIRALCLLLLEGDVEIKTLRESLRLLIQRHSALRTRVHFSDASGTPLQFISDDADYIWRELTEKVVEIPSRGWPRRFLEEERSIPISDTGPWLRATLLHSGRQRKGLLLNIPMLCCDGRTLNDLGSELSRIYNAPREESAYEIVQYLQFSEWLCEMEEGAEEGGDFWEEYVIHGMGLLPFEKQADSFSPELFFKEIAREEVEKIESFARASDCSTEIVLLACWCIFLMRLGRTRRLTVAACFDGRPFDEDTCAFGLYSRFLPVTTDLEEKTNPRTFLRQIQERIEEIADWQDYFDSNHQGEPVVIPFAFEFESKPKIAQIGGLSFSTLETFHWEEPSTLKLGVVPTEGAFKLLFYFNTDRLSHQQVALMADQFQTLLGAFVASKGLIESLSLISPAQKEKLLVAFNDTQSEPTIHRCIHEPFEERARSKASQPAVIYKSEILSLKALNEKANQLAHYLLDHGLRLEEPVGVFMERSTEVLIAFLGILKAGGVYLPIEMDNPTRRVAHILSDSNAFCLITNGPFPELGEAWNQKDPSSGHTLNLRMEDLSVYPSANPHKIIDPNCLAYIIYTSGSTGEPKGASITHRSPLNLLAGLKKLVYANMPARPLRVSVNAPFGFDGSIKQILMLTEGHCLCLIPQEIRYDGPAFLDYLKLHRIDVLDCTPPHLEILLREGLLELWPTPSTVLVGGESIRGKLWDQLNASREMRFFNIYGPTECTVITSSCAINDSVNEPIIGSPLPNCRLYVLEKQLQPAASCLTGEICIAGDGLARGYLSRPRFSAERFVPDPFSGKPGRRLYKTGDLARFRPDGNLEFLGRGDSQVKLRGFRFELGEIDSVLSRHPKVDQAVTVLAENQLDQPRLISYLVPYEELTHDTGAFYDHLAAHLPPYMIPSTIVVLSELPLTRTGKLDRAALPGPEGQSARKIGPPPTTPTEKKVSRIWGELLHQTQIGLEDNFFLIGGHSLLAIQVISRVREAFSVELPITSFFENPTLSRISAFIDKVLSENLLVSPLPLTPISRDRDIPLSFAQQRLWFLHQLTPSDTTYNMPLALRMLGPLNGRALAFSLSEIVRRHEVLRTTFPEKGGKPSVVIHPVSPIDPPYIDLRCLPRTLRLNLVQALVGREGASPFNLGTGPLIRLTVLMVEPEEHVFLATIHHIVTDGWSMGVIVDELVQCYRHYHHNPTNVAPAGLQELVVQYADFAHWQRQWLTEEALQRQSDYWQSHLAGIPPRLDLPTDRPRPPVHTTRGGHESFEIGPELTRELRGLGQQSSATIFMCLHVAFAVMLSRYSQQEDIVIGTPTANRTFKELEPLIGFFVNTLVLRLELIGDPSFPELLTRARKVALQAQTFQDIPFDRVVEIVQPERNMSHTPLFQVFFALQNAPKSALELPGLTLETVGGGHITSKFDLSLIITEQGSRLLCLFEYNAHLFDRHGASSMARHFQTLLKEIIEFPPSSPFPLVAGNERGATSFLAES